MRIGKPRTIVVGTIAIAGVTAVALWSGTGTRDIDGEGELVRESRGTTVQGAFGLQTYVDPDFDFSLAVPEGWQAVVMAEGDAANGRETGYAIGFESPFGRDDEVFSDYLMVEISPGEISSLFETDGQARSPTRVDGRSGWRDELALTMPVPVASSSNPGVEGYAGPRPGSAEAAVELIVRQAWFSGTDYTIALYAIGERSRRTLLDDAFEVMLRTFRLHGAPFDVV